MVSLADIKMVWLGHGSRLHQYLTLLVNPDSHNNSLDKHLDDFHFFRFYLVPDMCTCQICNTEITQGLLETTTISTLSKYTSNAYIKADNNNKLSLPSTYKVTLKESWILWDWKINFNLYHLKESWILWDWKINF